MIRAPEGTLGPSCGCCGAPMDASVNDLRSGRAVRVDNVHGVRLVARSVYRCEKHVGRAPCLIEGCGRTFRLDEGSYDVRYICGRHWRLAPRFMRDRCASVRKRARQRGWTLRLIKLHDTAFELCVRAVERRLEGGLDLAEIERMFGPIGAAHG